MPLSKPTTLKNAIHTLITKYPNGIPSTYGYHYYGPKVPANKLSQEEVKALLTACHNDPEQFKQLILSDPAYQEFVRQGNEYLLNNWLTRVRQSDTYRTNKIVQVERKKVADAKREEQHRQEMAAKREKERKQREVERLAKIERNRKEAERKRKAIQVEKNKAKRKVALWKQLNLTAEQKKLFEQLAK